MNRRKICLSGDERLFRMCPVKSRTLKPKDNGLLSRKAETIMKSKGYGNPANRNEETAVRRILDRGHLFSLELNDENQG